MSFNYLEFAFGVPGHGQRHPDPPDDHRLLDIRVSQWSKPDDASDDRGRSLAHRRTRNHRPFGRWKYASRLTPKFRITSVTGSPRRPASCWAPPRTIR